MNHRPISTRFTGPASREAGVTALNAAIIFRDCSFRMQSTADERRACRTLMREQALHWRQPDRAPNNAIALRLA